jgi:para-nitrobenzyl esterase
VIVKGQLREQLATDGWPLQQLIIGTNANEYYAAGQRGAGEAAIDAAVAAAEVLKTPEARAELRSTPDAAEAIDRLATADSMLCPAQQLAVGVAAARRPVWMYVFSRVREGGPAADLRAYHGAELPYVFGTHDSWLPTAPADLRLTREMMRAWVRFATYGSPGTSGAGGAPDGVEFRWPRFDAAALGDVLRFDATSTLVEAPERGLCRIYRERTAASPSQN